MKQNTATTLAPITLTVTSRGTLDHRAIGAALAARAAEGDTDLAALLSEVSGAVLAAGPEIVASAAPVQALAPIAIHAVQGAASLASVAAEGSRFTARVAASAARKVQRAGYAAAMERRAAK